MKYLKFCLACLLTVLVLAGCGAEAPPPTQAPQAAPAVTEPPVEAVHPEEPTEAPTQAPLALQILSRTKGTGGDVLNTSFCSLTIPFALSDLVQVEAEGETLRFFMELGDRTCDLYALTFGPDGQIPLGTLQVEDRTVPVWAQMAPVPEDLTEEELLTFQAAQETFNEVTASLTQNPGYYQ